MFTKSQIEQGVTLYTRKSEQFKTVSFSIKWKSELTEEKAAARAVLANVLQDSNAKYRTQGELRKKLDDLYGTVLYTDTAKRGATHMITLNVDCVNDEYINDSYVLGETLELIQTVIFNPNLVNGEFDQKIVAREKRSVTERIRSQYDNKTSYAQKRMLENLRPNSPVSTSSDGTEQAVQAITAETLLQAYESMIANDIIDIYVVGNIDEQEIAQKLKELLPFKARPSRQQQAFKTDEHKASGDVQHVREKQEMKQGKLHLAFSTPVGFHHPDYSKMQVTNGVFGGFAHSKLFMNVREKESMAYYASSSYSSHYGYLYVMAGIDAELEEKAVTLIKEQLSALQNGEITDLEMEQTKALLTNSITSTFDSARGQIEVFDQYKELDENFTADTLIKAWEAVTKDDVKEMASTIQLEIIYLLSGKETASNE
ncbi:EF-P 5-aminopentanol modification-associated protein YfmF [Sporosarcina pasteurii]|uniref:Peptidase M16 inactive domain n=1 Tax=Sporosarcina pasteurii TaxID=1474 RepID=A0A380BH43_SPOPA|nr:pitrilysin family protein [Sporosarcina pasteurii]MDS9470643.1 pitrilysin family protein [Sporosarcina pasteurii]QBQ05671.1 insulinase family protein [Sporosarcina pasteurii]SUJ01397.1 Peptidase M16 inactive domain [Sporosarcina pasteurii]